MNVQSKIMHHYLLEYNAINQAKHGAGRGAFSWNRSGVGSGRNPRCGAGAPSFMPVEK